MTTGQTILVVEDQPKLARLLKLSLESEGYHVDIVGNGRAALQSFSKRLPDLVILDLMLPGDLDGYQVCQSIRSVSDVPVIMLTGRARESDKLHGFGVGADDYVTKPFSVLELQARVKAVLNRVRGADTGVGGIRLTLGDLELDCLARRVYRAGEEVHLTPTEYEVLHQLALNAGKVLVHEDLLTKVWGPEYRDEYQYLRNYISNLRKKLEPDPAKPTYILSKPGIGYYMDHHPGNQPNR
ncbi:MAG: response regulator transcription factor [Bacillota bacterium]